MESLSQNPGAVDRITRVLQIIVIAMTIGLVTFLGIVVFLVNGSGAQPPRPNVNANANPNGGAAAASLPVLSVAALTFAVILVPLSLVVPRLVSDGAVKQLAASKPATIDPRAAIQPGGDIDRLALIYQTRTIIGAAMTEGPAFFAMVAYMIERSPIALVLGIFLIVAVAARFPQRGRVEAWIEDQLARVQLARQSAEFR